MLSDTVNKSEYNSNLDQVRKKIARHDDELDDIRQELANNNQFFTFYMNNADS